MGVAGVDGCALMVILEEATEVQEPFDTVKEKLPAAILLKFAVAPEPDRVAPPVAVTVQVPDEGNPISATVPVANEQVGWAVTLGPGAVGVVGCAFMVIAAALLIQPLIFFAVRL